MVSRHAKKQNARKLSGSFAIQIQIWQERLFDGSADQSRFRPAHLVWRSHTIDITAAGVFAWFSDDLPYRLVGGDLGDSSIFTDTGPFLYRKRQRELFQRFRTMNFHLVTHSPKPERLLTPAMDLFAILCAKK